MTNQRIESPTGKMGMRLSLGGFLTASMGSIAAVMVLDISGGGLASMSWGITFVSMGIIPVLGAIMLAKSSHTSPV